MKYRYIFVHLLNDYSGSPRVLLSTINSLDRTKRGSKLYVGSRGSGILSECEISVIKYWYVRFPNRYLTFISYFISQLILFLKLLTDRSIKKDGIVYVNTLLPFGAALYGRLTGKTVVYHIHELSLSPKLLKSFLVTISRLTSSLNIYVSDTHVKALPIKGVPFKRIYNSLSKKFLDIASASHYSPRTDGFFNVLMISSLKDYKGLMELLDLASVIEEKKIAIKFDLVLSESTEAIRNYFSKKKIPSNLILHSCVKDTASFYKKSNLVVNLSRVDLWIETFGLTVLEAMSFGVPVIAPPVGGPTELVDHGVNGFLVDSRDIKGVVDKMLELYERPELCLFFSKAAKEKAMLFCPKEFEKRLLEAVLPFIER